MEGPPVRIPARVRDQEDDDGRLFEFGGMMTDSQPKRSERPDYVQSGLLQLRYAQEDDFGLFAHYVLHKLCRKHIIPQRVLTDKIR